VDRLVAQDPTSVEPPNVFPSHQMRDNLGVNPRFMQILRDAMLAETEDALEGTGRHVKVPGMTYRVCGKTGTAERKDHGVTKNTVWFISYAPYEHPRYAVVVMVENGVSGGTTCSPMAGEVYLALQKIGQTSGTKTLAASNQ
jgi:penicillin-binding protein 2